MPITPQQRQRQRQRQRQQQRHHPYFLKPRSGPLAQAQLTYSLNQISAIYQFPTPSDAQVTVGVFSFGGGIRGTLSGGFLINGDPQQHWASLGISAQNHPRVIVVPVNGASFSTRPNPNEGATIENTIDIETIGALCPTSKLTIILYIANPYDDFPVLLAAAQTPVTVGGKSYIPSIISCSWGAPESEYDSATLHANNALFQAVAAKGITVTAASGDNGSSDGTNTTVADFPSSSPYVVACGGTSLYCPNGIYDGSTVETTWSGSGGGFASFFPKPTYQSDLSGDNRLSPDIALVADPRTGVQYTIGGASNQVVGGTSIVSPAIAAFAAALNIRQFLTPLLYSFPSTNYHDITVGTNGAYSAGFRYDNCTGLGSIVGSRVAASLTAPIPVQSVTLTGPTTVNLGQTVQLTATILPTTATNKAITFSSSNPGIASVSATGLVHGDASGDTTITVTTADGPFTASASLAVLIPPVIHVSSITFPAPAYSIAAGRTLTIQPTVTPGTAANKTVRFSSSNTTIATVDPTSGLVSGLATGVGVGTATITAISDDGGKIATTLITVTGQRVSGITLSSTAANLRIGNSIYLSARILPNNAANPTVTWSVSQPSPPVISLSNGNIRALKGGTAMVTATTLDGGKSARCTITVR